MPNFPKYFQRKSNKSPDIRPVYIGETLRRIVTKTVLNIVKSDIIESVGFLQTSVGKSLVDPFNLF